MKKFLVLTISVALLLGLLSAVVYAADTGVQWFKLIAGQTEHLGDIRVWIDDSTDDLHVKYHAFPGYCLQETHVHVADTLDGIPQVNGNPVPGQFASKHDELGCVSMDEHVFEGPWASGPLYIAAHASVGKPDDPEWQETGWGVLCGQIDEFAFPGNKWAAYILYDVP
jgi:hypothetical protein